MDQMPSYQLSLYLAGCSGCCSVAQAVQAASKLTVQALEAICINSNMTVNTSNACTSTLLQQQSLCKVLAGQPTE